MSEAISILGPYLNDKKVSQTIINIDLYSQKRINRSIMSCSNLGRAFIAFWQGKEAALNNSNKSPYKLNSLEDEAWLLGFLTEFGDSVELRKWERTKQTKP